MSPADAVMVTVPRRPAVRMAEAAPEGRRLAIEGSLDSHLTGDSDTW
jgi:hypothetical protein